MPIVLTVLAVILALWGITAIVQGAVLWGIILLVLACAVGPGGWSFYNRS